MNGYVKLHRKVLENPVVCKDADHMAIWIYLILHATHKEQSVFFGGQRVTLHPGQLITGRKRIAQLFQIQETKVQRILKLFENEQQITQQATNQNRLITVLRWVEYQSFEQSIAQRMNNDCTAVEQPMNNGCTTAAQRINNDCTTNEQPVNTNKKEKKEKKDKKERKEESNSAIVPDQPVDTITSVAYPYRQVIDYLNQKAGTSFRCTSKDTRKYIKARFDEGYSLTDFKAVVDKKHEEWGKEPAKGEKDMRAYLRPSTLFGAKFEGYLNQPKAAVSATSSNKFNNFPQRSYDYEELEKQLLGRRQGDA